jgi:hypothetical protein
MRVERLLIMLLGGALVWALWKLYRGKLRKMWQRVKDHHPRQRHPKSPKDCPHCCCGVRLETARINGDVAPWGERIPGLKGTYRDRTPSMALGLTDRVLTGCDILRTPLIPTAAQCALSGAPKPGHLSKTSGKMRRFAPSERFPATALAPNRGLQERWSVEPGHAPGFI